MVIFKKAKKLARECELQKKKPRLHTNIIIYLTFWLFLPLSTLCLRSLTHSFYVRMVTTTKVYFLLPAPSIFILHQHAEMKVRKYRLFSPQKVCALIIHPSCVYIVPLFSFILTLILLFSVDSWEINGSGLELYRK